MIEKLKSIDKEFRTMRWLAFSSLAVSLLLSSLAISYGFNKIDRLTRRIYVLSNGKAIRAMAVDPGDNLPVEARDHLRNFHHYFFDLSPDEKGIKASIDKSFYLADGSAKLMYDNLLESGFINGLVSGNITQSITLDSISVDFGSEPFAFRCTGVQTLIRQTSLTTRSIITRGFLRRTGVERSDNNPHAFLIERFEIEQNKEVKTVTR